MLELPGTARPRRGGTRAVLLARPRERLARTRAARGQRPSPRVRLEAVRAASFFSGTPALEAAYDVLKYDMDYYLEYTFKETREQVQRSIPEIFLPSDPKLLAALPLRMSDKDLLEAPGMDAILIERLERPGLNINARTAALAALATKRESTQVREAIEILRNLDAGERSPSAAENIGYILASMPRAELAKSRPTFSDLATVGKKIPVRQAAYAAVVAADGKPDAAWAATSKDPAARVVLIDSIALHPDADFRAAFGPLLDRLAADAATPARVRSSALLALPLMGPKRAGAAFRLLADNLRTGRDRADSSRALMQLPRSSWSAQEAGPAAAGVLTWARTVPEGKRANEDFVVSVQAARELAALLAPAESVRLRKELLGLGTQVFSLRSVREQMRYDVARIVVEAGKPFQIMFENSDMMPHNVTVMEPGAREDIGRKADAMPAVPDRRGRLFVPDDKRILAATAMVEPGRTATLKLTAPQKPGDYEYVCTYPDHWKTMYGQLLVVESLEAYMNSARALEPPRQTATGAGHGKNHSTPAESSQASTTPR